MSPVHLRTRNSKLETSYTGAQILISLLERQDIEIIPGMPGGGNLPMYDALYDSPVRHVLARHEQGAGFMAQGTGDRQPGPVFRDVRPRGDQSHNSHCRCPSGFDTSCRHHGSGTESAHRHRRVSGGRHLRSDFANHQAKLSGVRFDDRATGKAAKFCPDAQINHIDNDAGKLGRSGYLTCVWRRMCGRFWTCWMIG